MVLLCQQRRQTHDACYLPIPSLCRAHRTSIRCYGLRQFANPVSCCESRLFHLKSMRVYHQAISDISHLLVGPRMTGDNLRKTSGRVITPDRARLWPCVLRSDEKNVSPISRRKALDVLPLRIGEPPSEACDLSRPNLTGQTHQLFRHARDAW